MSVDYTKCNDYLINNPSDPFVWQERNPHLPPRWHYHPFRIKSNGDIEAHDSADIKTEGNIITITYRMPVIESLRNDNREQLKTAKKREVKFYIEKNPRDGSIIKVTEDFDYSESEIQAMAQAAEQSGNTGKDTYFAYIGSITDFEVKNGQCVPVRSGGIVARRENNNNYLYEMVTFVTELCYDINSFIRENREFHSCFSDRINKALSSIYEKHGEHINKPHHETLPFTSTDKINKRIISDFGPGNDRGSLSMQYSMIMTATQASVGLQQKQGIAPLITAFMTLANCNHLRLSPFFEDDRIWENNLASTQLKPNRNNNVLSD